MPTTDGVCQLVKTERPAENVRRDSVRGTGSGDDSRIEGDSGSLLQTIEKRGGDPPLRTHERLERDNLGRERCLILCEDLLVA